MASTILSLVTQARDWAVGPTTEGYAELKRSFKCESLFDTVILIEAQANAALKMLTAATEKLKSPSTKSTTDARINEDQKTFLAAKQALQVAREAKEAAHQALHHFQTASLAIFDTNTLSNIAVISPDLETQLQTIDGEKRKTAFEKLHDTYEKVHAAYDTFKDGPALLFRKNLVALYNNHNLVKCDNATWHSLPNAGSIHGALKTSSTSHKPEIKHNYAIGAMYYMLDTVTNAEDKSRDKAALLEWRKKLVIQLTQDGKKVPYWELVRYTECQEAAASAKAELLAQASSATQELGE